jgi:hypothetical protein
VAALPARLILQFLGLIYHGGLKHCDPVVETKLPRLLIAHHIEDMWSKAFRLLGARAALVRLMVSFAIVRCSAAIQICSSICADVAL